MFARPLFAGMLLCGFASAVPNATIARQTTVGVTVTDSYLDNAGNN